jgi:hypothetical protein
MNSKKIEILKSNSGANKIGKTNLIAGVIAIVAGFLILTSGEKTKDVLGIFNFVTYTEISTIIVAGLLIAYGISSVLVDYLKGNSSISQRIGVNESSYYLDKKMDIVLSQIEKFNEEAVKSYLKEEPGSIDAAFKKFQDQLLPSVINDLESKFGESSIEEKRWSSISRVFFEAQRRLLREIDALGRRGNVNLIVGVITTALAIGLLIYLVVGNPQKIDDLPSILVHYVPRLTLVIFVEVFSFFFLRLYRASLFEIRTYQEDLTRLAIQEVAVTSAWTISDKAARAVLSTSLIATSKAIPAKLEKTSDSAAMVDLVERLAKVFAKVKGEEKS